MKKTLIFLIFLSFFLSSYSQKDLRNAYVITNSKDTLVGMISFQSDMKNSTECLFFPETEVKEEFHPFDIMGYRFADGKYYVSKYVEEADTTNKIFAEYLVRGLKDLFYFRDMGGFHYLISKNDSTLINIPYKDELITIDGKQYLHESTKHIGLLKTYFSDCPSLFDEIDNMKKPDKKNLISITKKYNDKVCGENTCIIYKKKRMPLRLAFEPRFEISKFKGQSTYSNHYGGLVYIWLPVSNENLYLKTGVMYYKSYENTSNYKIPIQFSYIIPYKVIRPKFDLGVNIYSARIPEYLISNAMTLAASGGFLVRATKFMYLDLYFETDILQFKYETKLFISHSFGLGVFVVF
jgi:hypothetical protein